MELQARDRGKSTLVTQSSHSRHQRLTNILQNTQTSENVNNMIESPTQQNKNRRKSYFPPTKGGPGYGGDSHKERRETDVT